MGTYRIAVVVGSLRKDSFNRKLATALARLAPADFAFQQVRIDDLPLYNQDDDGAPAEAVRRDLGAAAGQRLIVASAGGGKVGGEVLAATLAACR